VLKAHENGLITGFAPDMIDKGLDVLQNADDTVFVSSMILNKL
jgi:hypothetical protein